MFLSPTKPILIRCDLSDPSKSSPFIKKSNLLVDFFPIASRFACNIAFRSSFVKLESMLCLVGGIWKDSPKLVRKVQKTSFSMVFICSKLNYDLHK